MATSEMTGLERALAALSYQKPDRVPVASLVCGASRRILGCTYDKWASDAELCAESQLQAHKFFNNEFDIFVTLVDLSVEAEAIGQKVLYPMESTPYPDFNNQMVKTSAEYHGIPTVNMREVGRTKMIIDVVHRLSKAKGKEYGIAGFVLGPLCVLGAMRGHEKMFVDCLKNPEDLKAGLEIVTPMLIDYAVAQVEAGAHAIVLDTLYSCVTIMNTKLWAKVEGPYVRQICDAIRAAGAGVVLHNCGGGIYFDVQQEYCNPVAISHAYPAADCKDWNEHAEKWGKKIVSIGYMDPAQCGMVLDEEGVMNLCREVIDAFKVVDGGFILATGCEFPPNGSLLNARAILNAAKAYGTYS